MTVDVLGIEAGSLTFTAHAAGPPDGRLVLLLHGFPQSSFMWRHQMAALAAAGCRAVAVDQRGYSPGARPPAVDDYRLDHLVSDVVAIADGLGADRVDLVGHDWGGGVAWVVAARHPERVRTLTVVSMPHPAAFAEALFGGDTEQAAKSGYIAVLRVEGAAEQLLLAGDGEGLRRVFAGTGHPDPEGGTAEYVKVLSQPGAMTAALNWYRSLEPEDAPEVLGGLRPVTVPTLYVWGDGDSALGRAAAEATGEHVEGPYRFEPLAGVGHWIAEEVPERLSELLLAHLASYG